nr:M14 family metallopeptidase [Lederbergia lenta]
MTPEYGYDKTIYIGAGVHGTEWAGKLAMLRIAQIICEKWKANPQISYLRNNVRLVIIPIVNPWGHDNKALVNSNSKANTQGKGVNLNRNHDAMRFNTIMSAGSDHNGDYPFSEKETQWVKETIEWIGYQNIHYAFDFHDAPTASKFGDYWINLNTFHESSKKEIKKLTWYLAEKNITDREPYVWHDKDTTNAGTLAVWMNKTMGVPASTVEHCYELLANDNFNVPFMTKAVEVYINTIIAISITEHRHPVIGKNNMWLDLQWYKSATGKEFWKRGSYEEIMSLWDNLSFKYPKYVKKSSYSVLNSDGKPVHYYTLAPKKYTKTVLIVGARSYPNTNFDNYEASLLKFAELLCEYGDQIDNLSTLRNDTRVVFIPCLENGTYYLNSAGNFTSEGTPNMDKTPVSNIISIMDEIGKIDGVIYSQELNNSNITSVETTDVFVLPNQDDLDSIGVEDYTDHLSRQGLSPELKYNAATEFANYVYQKKNIPCVRIDTGLDHMMYEEHKNEWVDVNGIVTLPVDQYLKMNYEIARRINNIANISKLMIKE